MRLDVLKSISGVSFAEAWRSRISARFEGKPVAVIGLDAYVKNKRASGRAKDLLDAAVSVGSSIVATLMRIDAASFFVVASAVGSKAVRTKAIVDSIHC